MYSPYACHVYESLSFQNHRQYTDLKEIKTTFHSILMPFFKCIFKDLLTNLNVRFCFFPKRES